MLCFVYFFNYSIFFFSQDVDGIHVILSVNYEGINILQNGIILSKFPW